MQLLTQSIEILDPATPEEWLHQFKKVERAYRVCYKSEGKATDDSYLTFIPSKIKAGHYSPLEHANITIRLITSRAIQQELTRHRLAAFSIESTRWISYFKKQGGLIDFIQPAEWDSMTDIQQRHYREAMTSSEHWYNQLCEDGLKPQIARDALSLGLKGEIIMTANVRQWLHIFDERLFNKAAHPDIRQISGAIYDELLKVAPPFFLAT